MCVQISISLAVYTMKNMHVYIERYIKVHILLNHICITFRIQLY